MCFSPWFEVGKRNSSKNLCQTDIGFNGMVALYIFAAFELYNA
jgi:hypothetical protein